MGAGELAADRILLHTLGRIPKLRAVAWLEFQIPVGVCTAPSSYDAGTRSPAHRHTDLEFGQRAVEIQVLAESRRVCAT